MPDPNCQFFLTDRSQLYDTVIQTPLSVVSFSARRLPSLVEHLRLMSQQRADSHQFFALTDNLTPPEVSGLITTQLSLAFHALLAQHPKAHIVVSQENSKDLVVPDPNAYASLVQQYTLGQRLSLSSLTRSLVQAGYTRFQGGPAPHSFSEVGFRVRGEAVDLAHPLWNTQATLTFHGNTLENIMLTKERRSRRERSLVVPPLKFPEASLPFEKLAARHAPCLEISPLLIPTTSTISASPISRERALELLSTLEVGKPAVHADHGIGFYEGLHVKHAAEAEHEYLVLQYAQGDLLYVPVEFAHKVTAYLGEGTPRIHRLGGTLWSKTKRKAKEEAAAFAKELLTIAGKRSRVSRPAYHIHEAVEASLDQSFPFALTPDQARTWHEVKGDLTKERPADRIVVGDVGFGKTEIAVRAARHVVENGKQVAILAPTTLLVQQHFDTFRQRLAGANIHLLSRFTSLREARLTREKIASGQCQIAIGTHALLGRDLAWHNLGLVIIDEEQKFGVRQKEHFKKTRAGIDVISLSATPIPRTLAIALSGLRDLSLIQTAPAGRQAVATHVSARQDVLMKQAIEQELDRSGQVYAVASKIRYLPSIREHLAALVPKARTAIAHGRLPGKTLAATMHGFDTGTIDILISSNIVENGLDLPNVNTLIVWNATDFGLSDLYQLRGRVGRRSRQGHAYFLYQQAELTAQQRERLAALTEASRLGSGWNIARRDLEIRGAGNLLGREQSGTANEVGIQLYLDLVRHATQELSATETPDILISLPLPALLPATYIPATGQRAQWYQRLARAATPEQLQSLTLQLEQEFGSLPGSAQNLILQLELQHAARRSAITKIDSKKITPPGEAAFYRVTLHGQAPATIETPEITPSFVQHLIATLRRSS